MAFLQKICCFVKSSFCRFHSFGIKFCNQVILFHYKPEAVIPEKDLSIISKKTNIVFKDRIERIVEGRVRQKKLKIYENGLKNVHSKLWVHNLIFNCLSNISIYCSKHDNLARQ